MTMQHPNAWSKITFALVCSALCVNGTAQKAYAMSFGQYAASCAANGGRAIVQNGVYTCVFSRPAAPPPPPDPQVLAAQRVAPQFRALVAKLSDPTSVGSVLAPGWDAIATSTPEQLQSAMQRLFDGLYSSYRNDERETAGYEQNLWYRDRLAEQVAAIEPQVAAVKNEIAKLHGQLEEDQTDGALYERVNGQLEAASNSLEQTTARLQDQTIGWIRAALPAKGVHANTWRRWRPTFSHDQIEPGEVWSTPLTFTPGALLPERPIPPVAAQAMAAFGPVDKPPLPASLDDRMAAVSKMADVAQKERALLAEANNGGAKAVSADIDRLSSTLDQDRALETNGDIMKHNLDVQLIEANNRLAQLKVDEEILARRHAAAVAVQWIWENAKEQAIDVIKTEITRYALELGAGKAGFTIDDAAVAEAIETGRANIFGLTDHILQVQDLIDVVDSVHALADHTVEYATVTARYAAAATPEQWAEADALAHRGLDKDVEAIQNRTLSATGLREPFKTVYFRIVGQPEAEQ